MGFSNSPLVSYTRLSPNHSGKRKAAIDTITPHTMAGNLSVQTCGELFAREGRKASSHYGIDSNGTVALYVEECNRPWTTSSASNDHRAVTIEVASVNQTDYRPSNAAYDSLIKLMADICRRNGIPELRWKANKGLIGKVDQQNITAHRWFAAKGCPGNWMYDHMAEIAVDVNKLLASVIITDEEEVPSTVEGTGAAMSAEDIIYKYLEDHGLNIYAIAGLMGNWFAESGLVSNNLQNSFEAKLKHTDASYTAAVDNGTYTNFVRDGAGYGLCQWTYWSRKEGLLKLAKATDRSIGDIYLQLDHFWNEFTTQFKSLYTKLQTVTSYTEASDLVLIKFENPGGYGDKMPDKYKTPRRAYAKKFYDKYRTGIVASAPATPTAPPTAPADTTEKVESKFPYKVRVKCNSLRIRNGAGTDKKVVGGIKDHGVYTIVEESSGKGAKVWGRLQSGNNRWIAVDAAYVEKL